MKPTAVPFLVSLALALPSCDKQAASDASSSTTEESVEKDAARKEDIPILPIEKGAIWEYEAKVEIPAGVTSRGAAAVQTSFTRTRRYLGKVKPAEELPETDCFEVSVPGSPDEREFVEIHDDRVLLRGSLIMRPETTRPLWYEHPVPFVEAGMRPGTEAPGISAGGGAMVRRIQVIAREKVTVPAGEYDTIRLLMTGTDGDMELRRTIWFAPGTGIVREEKTRYRGDRLLFREEQALARTNVSR